MPNVTISCPNCQNPIPFEAFDIITNDSDNRIREQLIRGDFFRFECGNCHYQNQVVYPLIYIDDELDLILYLKPKGEKDDLLLHPQVVRKLQEKPNMLTRSVVDEKQLVEKILIRVLNLDDRLMEMVKVESRHFMSIQDPDLPIEKMFLNSDKEGMFLTCFLSNGRMITLELDPEVFNLAKKKYQETLKLQNEYRFMTIDEAWAQRFLEIHLAKITN